MALQEIHFCIKYTHENHMLEQLQISYLYYHCVKRDPRQHGYRFVGQSAALHYIESVNLKMCTSRDLSV